MVEYYKHHGQMVAVRKSLKGMHREHCLCYICRKFKPGDKDNCPKAQKLYEFDVENDMTTPVFECSESDFKLDMGSEMTLKLESDVIREIQEEIRRSSTLWGENFDDKNSANDWVSYVIVYLGQAVRLPWYKERFCENMIKAAGLCISALKTFYRNDGLPKRHYDE